MDLLSNSAFAGADSEGMPLPTFSDGDGIYHVPGLLIAAPPSTIKKALQAFLPFIEVAKGATLVLIALAPRYVYKKCCNSADQLIIMVQKTIILKFKSEQKCTSEH
jgi:hypothetical protein